MKITLKNPQLSSHLSTQFQDLSEKQRTQKAGQIYPVYNALRLNKPEIAKDLLRENIAAFENSGNEESADAASRMLQLIDMSPEVAAGSMGSSLYGLLGEKQFLGAFDGGDTARVKGFSFFNDIIAEAPRTETGELDAARLTPTQKAAAIELGMVPRAGTSAKERIALDAEKGQAVAEQAAAEEAAKEAGKLTSQLKLKPDVAAAVESALLTTRNEADIASEGRSNARALSTYDTAMTNLVESLGGTITGPVAGWLPAMSANAQIAEGATAVMAPVLKSIFREAGEGTFTDQDQKMLLDMLPTRKDKKAAREAKMSMIDAVVRAKLGQESAPTAESGMSEAEADALIDSILGGP